ncbi:GH36-type glycosyl hydrolase domain-containing protein [Alicyclobacillus herbarius]|uniref:GH36-type glycosyl hydrolase domain-containing protein n=1 Tax=Alicyclobacillus herbarius TaxID=122960 RepID=UPI00041A1035|nr:glucoamylase family protein [Alicyclobacillus herbarius]
MILNRDQLTTHARELALTHELDTTRRLTPRFWPGFQSSMKELHEFADKLTYSRVECKQPAEDWLLDHIAFLETQAQVVMRELPPETLHPLPKLQGTGLPRIYAICDDYLAHVDGRYEVHSFETYLEAYQEVAVLKIAECWALPSAMRIVIIHRLAQAMREVRRRHDVCGFVASLLERAGAENLSDVQIRELLERETHGRMLDATEVVHFVRHLSELEPDMRTVWNWLAAHVENNESSLEQMVSFEHQLQAELQVTCGNLVQSLHVLERMPWRLVFTRICRVEQILLTDASHDYERLDLSSRDLLRGRVADVARQLNVPETLVAQTSVRLAKSHLEEYRKQTAHGAPDELPPRSACLAYYLFDPHGVTSLRQTLSDVARPRRLPQIALRRRPLSTYLVGGALIFAGLLVLGSLLIVGGASIRLVSWLAVLLALLIPASEWAIALLHGLIDRCCKPTPLLRYDFSQGLPEDARTMVVMPVIWSSVEEVDDVMDRLLVHYLANRQANIHFAVLADFTDAPEATEPGDEAIVAHAIRRLEALQEKYGRERFFLFHRERRLNAVDQVYAGWERKRGKLVEFVELLSGSTTTSFTTVRGQTEVLPNIRYVFTVDLDTKLPIGVVGRMAGTIHLPYHRPRLNETETRVQEGYGVLQPRIGMSFASTQKSRFAELWAGEPGIDPYAFAASNPYQDLFDQAMFVGKGIFDVEAFRKTLVNRIPDNQVLSHDILEGGFLRAGLTSDIEVVEEFPTTYYAYQSRAHRWIRGDWQLLRWLGRSCKDRHGNGQKIDLCGLTRWHIIDNLRKSLLAPVLLLVAWLGLFGLPGRAFAWETMVLLTWFLPFWRACGHCLLGVGSWRAVRVSFLQSVVQMMTWPFVAVLNADAILRTLYRMFISHRHLLEWVTSAELDRKPVHRRVFLYEPLGYVVAALFVVTAWLFDGITARIVAVVAFVLWALARPVVQSLNRPRRDQSRDWVTAARPELKELASQIWSFYERYVTAEESWLPPDNVQYYPEETIAHRTSPTNIGLYLASVVAARDLGFIDSPAMLERLEATVATLRKLEKWHGHLFNWYDTRTAQPLAPRYVSTVDSGNLVAYLMLVRQGLADWAQRDPSLQPRAKRLLKDIDALIEETRFEPLYNPDERLFSIGYRVDANQKDRVLYDLLASEARQASFVAIALGQIPVSHWFTLSRTLTIAASHKTLLSWSGTMFEYLMPALILRTYPNTVWDSTYRGVVARQKEYADIHRVPFGTSESGYYAFDSHMNYQYRAFGIPGLGLDRGLERNLVVAPYATILALPIAGEAGMAALRQFEQYGAKGEFGYYEAVDFTVERLPVGTRHQVVRSFMAHHQGMSLLTLANLLTDDVLIDRFHGDPRVQATELLLQERIPAKAVLIKETVGARATLPKLDGKPDDATRTVHGLSAVPEVNVMSNGRMTSVLTGEGNGMLSWNGLSVTRFREDPVVDSSGMAIYIHDEVSEETWSPTRFPCQREDTYQVEFRLDKSTFETTCHGIESSLAVTVAPDVDAEVRRLRLVNHSDDDRTLEVTSFLELALASQAADSAHPAFSKLFVQTIYDQDSHCLLAKRRPRAEDEKETWAVHTVYVEGQEVRDDEFETDRAAFIGRGFSLSFPQAMSMRLRGSVGSVADPAFVMRRSLHLAPGESATVYFVTGVAESRKAALDIVSRLREPAQAERAFHVAWVRRQIDLRHLHLTPAQAAAAHLLAGRLLFTPPLSRVRREAILHNQLGISALWARGISGDAPIVTVSVSHLADLPFVTLLARQHQYLFAQGLALDLVILDETVGGNPDELMRRLRESLAARGIADLKRIINIKAEQLANEERILLAASSRVWLRAGGPSLRAQLRIDPKDLPRLSHAPLPHEPRRPRDPHVSAFGEFFNGWGGFVDDGRAYQIHVPSGAYLPRPWTNVLANPQFGCIVTELGTGYSWWRNSHECKLTPWYNDPVLDPPGECLYLRDLTTNDVWSAAPKPAGGERTYQVTHGWGYTRIEQMDGDIVHTLEMTVPLNDPLKILRLRLRNRGDKAKRIAVTYYAEWVIGVLREAQAPFIVSEWDPQTRTLLARNPYQEAFRNAVGFLHVASEPAGGEADRGEVDTSAADSGAEVGPSLSWTADRADFIGRGGTRACPAALLDDKLSGRTGAFANTCGAVQTIVDVPAGGDVTVVILLGCADSTEGVQALVQKYSRAAAYDEALAEVTRHWERVTGQVAVKTPDRALDVMLGGWLLYQALACRLWARTAFYQAGGAFGFRDQLQDSLAFLHVDASITRQQILRNAAHQYEEGDVQHWWHEETRKGIRTRFSDDLLWLPYATSRYVEQTGDVRILAERVPFLHSDPLKEGELERYEDMVESDEQGTLLEHCLRAIRHTLARFGEHGIPLIGIGDWNDGMNRVGDEGRGESVWLGWFLLDILKRFIQMAEDVGEEGEAGPEREPGAGPTVRDDHAPSANVLGAGELTQEVVDEFRQAVADLERNLNEHAWDGAWFRRAFTDDGAWLGSTQNKECRIDAIAQSWSVISQGTSKERQERAMKSFDRELVERELSLARLLTKAFDQTRPSPGYIQGYPPGIRENGGQYTHGVIWSIVAWAMLGRRDKAFELFAMLNPIAHTSSLRDVRTFGNEPYVMSADVYTADPHRGRAGWSWYTGAAGWMYQAGLEYVLGVMRRRDKLYIRPCVPPEWDKFHVDYRYGDATYHIDVYCNARGGTSAVAGGSVNRTAGGVTTSVTDTETLAHRAEGVVPTWIVDGREMSQPYLQLVDDGEEHQVTLYTARAPLSTVG